MMDADHRARLREAIYSTCEHNFQSAVLWAEPAGVGARSWPSLYYYHSPRMCERKKEQRGEIWK
jgi:hypothetical protein